MTLEEFAKKGGKRKSSQKDANKLKPIAECLLKYLQEKTGKQFSYELEYKPVWSKTIPDKSIIHKHWKVIETLYPKLVDEKYNLNERLLLCKKSTSQSFDIWFKEPFNFAVEFDESQHFSQFRKLTLDYYKGIKIGFDIEFYRSLMENKNPGTSGFQCLKTNDPLFPYILPGEKQDNRIRQRAFRDFLKDILPLEMGFNPTIRIPYQIVNEKINDFDSEDLKKIVNYFANIVTKIKLV
ncbi:MAG: hypothetical protein HDQ88_06315 [Clostridia bacterium]|nr:hypothetical protein [Clostridia bacterium]